MTDNQLKTVQTKADGTPDMRGGAREGSGRPVSHGMRAFALHGEKSLTKDQRARKTYIDSLLRESAGRDEMYHEAAVAISLIILETTDYLRALDRPDKQLSQTLATYLGLLKRYLDDYPENEQTAPEIIDAIQKADDALKQDWSINNG